MARIEWGHANTLLVLSGEYAWSMSKLLVRIEVATRKITFIVYMQLGFLWEFEIGIGCSLLFLQIRPMCAKYFLSQNSNLLQGAQEMDQQWINSGAKQCSHYIIKKISLPICLFLEQTKWTLIRFLKKMTPFIFRNEAPKAALSKYGIRA